MLRSNGSTADMMQLLFACAWVFPGLLLLGLPFIPESPYWYILRGNTEMAEKSLKRLRRSSDVSVELSRMLELAELEKEAASKSGSGSYIDCFKGTDWRRTRINLLCNYMPQIVGATLASNAPYFLSQTGMTSQMISMLVQIGISFGVISAILTLWLLSTFKFRPLIFVGTGICVLLFTAMGIAGCFPNNATALWVVGISLQVVPWTYGPCIGSTVAIASEISSARLRAKTIAIGQCFSSIVSTAWLFVLPYLFTSTEANLGGKIGWIFAAMALVYLVWAYFEIPEIKGLNFAQMDENFVHKVATRRFGEHQTVIAEAKV